MEKNIRKITQTVKNKNYNKQLEKFNYMDNKDLENEIAKIKERNKRVELDKAWE